MKTLVLSSEDIQHFTKLIYDSKTAVQLANNTDGVVAVAAAAAAATAAVASVNSDTIVNADNNLMALQYYLKHPGNYGNANKMTQHQQQYHHHNNNQYQTAVIIHPHQQLLVQSQKQLKQLQLKQPTLYQQQHGNYYHHPYYQHQHQSNIALPVHALNQNSNFSAASSSTGGGTTTSSHAPTQQSNSSSISPITRNIPASHSHNTAAASSTHGGTTATATLIRSSTTNSTLSSASCTKKIKTEPILSSYNQTERLSFANTHIGWSEENWKRVIFQDERKFNLDGPDGFSYYFHDLRNYERMLSQRPRGNSVYIYLLITVGGPIHLEVSTSKLKPETCIETILRERSNIINKLGGHTDFILQDHNWMSNALPTAQEWLNVEGLKIQKWPTIAHDLNIMENIWGWLIREVFDGGRKFSRKDDLIFRIHEAWARLPLDLVMNLYSTLPERITELYYTRGIYTNC